MPKRKTNDRKKFDKAKTQHHQRSSLRGQMSRTDNWDEYKAIRKRLAVIK